MDVITEACNDASDEIDSYCGKKFVVPFDPVPDEIKRACKTIIGYNLFNRRVASGQVNKYENAYDRIVKWLILISQGKATIDGAVKATANPTQTGGQVSGTHRTFTDKSMKGF
jgi:phage gp36-like protein